MTFVKSIGNISGCLVPAVSSPLSLESSAVLINPARPCVLALPSHCWWHRDGHQVLLGMAPAWPARALVPVGFSLLGSTQQGTGFIPSLWPKMGSGGPAGQDTTLLVAVRGHQRPPVGFRLLLQPGPALLPVPELLSCSPPTGEEFSPPLLRNFFKRGKRAGLWVWD